MTISMKKLELVLAAETVAASAFDKLSESEKSAYQLANYKATAASASSWWKSLSPKQQADYKKLHPGSKIGGGSSAKPKDDYGASAVAKAHKTLAEHHARKAAYHAGRLMHSKDQDEDRYFAHLDPLKAHLQKGIEHDREHKKMTGQPALVKGSSLHSNFHRARNYWNKTRTDKVPLRPSEE